MRRKKNKKSNQDQAWSQDNRIKKQTQRKSYSVYIYKVLKILTSETEISQNAMTIMDNFLADMFERLATEASKLMRYRKRTTLSSHDIQSAVRLLLVGELGKHAEYVGKKAVTQYFQNGRR